MDDMAKLLAETAPFAVASAGVTKAEVKVGCGFLCPGDVKF